MPIMPGPAVPAAVVPPRPKLMPTSPPGVSAQGAGQWLQALIWLPSPPSTMTSMVADEISEDHICYQKHVFFLLGNSYYINCTNSCPSGHWAR